MSKTAATKKSASKKAGTELQEFRKSNDAIGLRVRNGQFSLLSRKLFNVMIYEAQQQRSQGQNCPPNVENAANYYWTSLGDIAANAKYNSKDTEIIKEAIYNLQSIKVVMEDQNEWTSETLLSSVKIVNSNGQLTTRGGKLYIGFAFPPEVQRLVLQPSTYTKLSLFYTMLLRSVYSISLYENTRRYATSPSRLTARMSWQDWFAKLSPNPIDNIDQQEYKYFKRDMLRSAIAEINSATDIVVELIEHRDGRRVREIQFKVLFKEVPEKLAEIHPLVDSSVINRVMAFGISEADATAVFLEADPELLKLTLDLVEKRLRSKSSARLDSPAAYFRKALREQYAKGMAAPSPKGAAKQEAQDPRTESPLEQLIAFNSLKALEHYEALAEAEQKALFKNFSAICGQGIKPMLKRGLDTPMARAAFSQWYAIELFGEPTEDDVTQFAQTTLDLC